MHLMSTEDFETFYRLEAALCPTMANQQFASKLQEEVICPICMDILQGPATIDCGHTFCLRCITQSWEAADSILKCPLCNKTVRGDTIAPNWLLANLVGKIQAMDPSEMQPETKELRCLRHGEKCHFFCEFDGKFLCVVCRESKDHKSHNATLIEEAAQSYQGRIQSQVEALQQKERAIVQMKSQGEQRIDVFMDIKAVLCRSEGFCFLNPTPVSMHLEKKLSEAKSRHDSFTESLKKFKGKEEAVTVSAHLPLGDSSPILFPEEMGL
ncbi:E3 ubiquitin-protein ligase TRIM31, partial [Eschrichtius robustus]|nr:E3 ubiquitin-protein ligase TRIM31 [Eschrichtius robustus]